MKIILTESQYQKLTEDKLREFLYGFWNNQKKHGEEPSLDDKEFDENGNLNDWWTDNDKQKYIIFSTSYLQC